MPAEKYFRLAHGASIGYWWGAARCRRIWMSCTTTSFLLAQRGLSGNRESIEKKISVPQVMKEGHNSSNNTLDIFPLQALGERMTVARLEGN
jgi:hypothetical protein